MSTTATIVKVVESTDYPFPKCLLPYIGFQVPVMDITEFKDKGVVWVRSMCGHNHPVLAEALEIGEEFCHRYVTQRGQQRLEAYKSAYYTDLRSGLVSKYGLHKRAKATVDLILDIVQKEMACVAGNVAGWGALSYGELSNVTHRERSRRLGNLIDTVYQGIQRGATCIATSIDVRSGADEIEQARLMADIFEQEAIALRKAVRQATEDALQVAAESGVQFDTARDGSVVVPIDWPQLRKRVSNKTHYVKSKVHRISEWHPAHHFWSSYISVGKTVVAEWELARPATPEELAARDAAMPQVLRERACAMQKIAAIQAAIDVEEDHGDEDEE